MNQAKHPAGTYFIETDIVVDWPIEEVFAFFADAGNLEQLTPPWLRFEILSPRPIAMRVGTLIDYSLRVRGVPIRWQSEITAWEPPHRFVDEQRRGPYRVWIHEHSFEAVGSSTRVRDRVEYAAMGGWIVQWLLVGPDLKRIFEYRTEALRSVFGGAS